MTTTISLCMICKNEQANIGRLLDQVCPVLEEVVVVDTGSTDGTLDILKEKQQQYSNLRIEFFTWIDDFSAARNYAFSLGVHSWLMFLDCDDNVDTTLLKRFKDNVLNDPDVDVWELDYVYSQFPDGSPQTILGRERFIRKSVNPKWINAIHETIDISGLRRKHYNDLKVYHNREGKTIDWGRNLRILKSEFSKNPNDARTAYYYGKELFDHINQDGIKILEHYLTLPCRYFDDEIGARFRLAKHYLHEKRHGDAIRVIEPVYHLDFTRRRAEYYWIFGAVEQDLGNYEVAIEWYERCLKEVPPPPRVLSLEYYGWNPLRRISECYNKLGNNSLAFYYAKKVLEKIPHDQNSIEWTNSLRLQTLNPYNGHTLVTINFTPYHEIRADSYQATDLYLFPEDLPFRDESIDGFVVDNRITEDMVRVLKPVGFVWSFKEISHPMLQRIGDVVDYRSYRIYSYTKIDIRKPVIGYNFGDVDFGPYRIRILNLINSAIKKGYKTKAILNTDGDCDLFYGSYIPSAVNSPIKILDVCELLDKNTYSSYNIEKADIVVACSDTLYNFLKAEFPDKKLLTIDDHYELSELGWL